MASACIEEFDQDRKRGCCGSSSRHRARGAKLGGSSGGFGCGFGCGGVRGMGECECVCAMERSEYQPVTIAALLTFVKEGKAPLATPRYPVAAIFERCGARPRTIAALRYSSLQPSIQITAIGRSAGGS